MATVKSDNSGRIFKAIREALKKEVLVGVPDSSADRQPAPGEKGTPPSNAVIGYLMEHGSDEHHIPPRPFLVPGVRSIQGQASGVLLKGITGAFLAKPSAYDAALAEVGAMAVASVQATMIAGGFAPLSDRTIEARARRRYEDTGKLVGTATSRNARKFLKLRAEGTPDDVLHDAGLATPLLDTRSLFRSITYVIRNKRG